eukprot:scaffold2167_cov363-Pavlova_lutheri.AAC.19
MLQRQHIEASTDMEEEKLNLPLRLPRNMLEYVRSSTWMVSTTPCGRNVCPYAKPGRFLPIHLDWGHGSDGFPWTDPTRRGFSSHVSSIDPRCVLPSSRQTRIGPPELPSRVTSKRRRSKRT